MTALQTLKAKKEQAHVNCIWGLNWQGDDLYTGGLDGIYKRWNVGVDEIVERYSSGKAMTGVTSIAVVKDGSMSVVCHQHSLIRFFDNASNTEIAQIDPGLLEAWTISISPGDDILAAGTYKGDVNIWSMQDDHEKLTTLSTQSKFIVSLAFNVKGGLATAGIDGMVSIFDVQTQNVVSKLDAHAMPIRSIAFSPDGNLLYTASDDRHIKVHDLRNGTVINSFSHFGLLHSVDASPNHRHFASACSDHSVVLWDIGMQKLLKKYSAHKDHVMSVKFDCNDSTGRRFASVGNDSLLQIYE